MICDIGATSFGQTSMHWKQCVQSKMPCGSSAKSRRRSSVAPSRGSPTKRYDLARAAGPTNSGSTSSDRQAPTQAPHWMHAIDWVMSIIDSAGTMYSRSGGGPSGRSHGTTRCTFFLKDRVHVDDQVLE